MVCRRLGDRADEEGSGWWGAVLMTQRRNVIVHIAASADGYIARPDGDIDWLTSRPAPKGFYGMNTFMRSIDTMLLGRKTYEASLRMGATFDSKSRHIVFSQHAPERPRVVEPWLNTIGMISDQV
jgi:dihydrofolate reductase